MLMLARYDARSDVLLDPMAGSGTIGIEAAAMAAGRGVWCSGRTPACSLLPEFAAQWPKSTPALFGDTRPPILCNDIDAKPSSWRARTQIRLGYRGKFSSKWVTFDVLSPARVSELLQGQEYKSGLIISNPPYGQRMGDPAKLVADYQDLGRWCRQFRGFPRRVHRRPSRF